MKHLVAVGLGFAVAGCVPTTYTSLAMGCSESIGQPISERIAALGPPATVIRISPTLVGYIFKGKETAFFGGERYYTVNYISRSEKHHTPIYPVTTTCRGTFIVNAPSDATPIAQRIIVDVQTY